MQGNNKLLISAILIGLLVVITGCQAPESNPVSKVESPQQTMMADNSSQAQHSSRQNSESDSSNSEIREQKIIKEARLRLESKDLSKVYPQIKELVSDYDGYIANSRHWESNNQQQHYRYILKIPQKHFTTILTKLEQLGVVQDKEISSQDVTKEYIDLQARLKNFKAQEERYLELLEEAQAIEDILKIEQELNRVRTKIEQIQGQLKYYNNRIELATITLNLSEPRPVMDSNLELTASFKEAVRRFIDSINLIIVLVGALIPWLIVLGVVGTIGYLIFKAQRN
ncbi:MAG: DUF4349 domain-containing protein [Bacillota bacterium]